MGAIVAYYVIAAIIIYFLSYKLNEMLMDDLPPRTGGGHLVNTRDNKATIPLIYGICRVGLRLVYLNTSGSDNKYIHIIGVIGEGEIDSIYQVESVDQLYFNEKLYTEYADYVYYEFFNGSPTQTVCSTLHNAIPEWNDPLKNTAYLYIRLKYHRDVWQGLPDITVVVKGLKVYNPDTEVTEYSNNPALAVRDILTRDSEVGGMGIASNRINDTTVISAASYCTTKGWTVGISLHDAEKTIDRLVDMILVVFRGALIYSVNLYKVLYRDLNYESVVLTLDEEDIIEDGDISSLRYSQPSIFDAPNALKLQYIAEEKKYILSDYVHTDKDAIESDGDYRENVIDLSGINNKDNLLKMANYLLERARTNRTGSFTGRDRCLGLDPMDLIALSHVAYGWDEEIFRVTNVVITEDLLAGINFIEEHDSFYNDTYNSTEETYHQTNLPSPLDAVPSVINVSNKEILYDYRDRSFTKWLVKFDPPRPEDYPWWDYAEIWSMIDDINTIGNDISGNSFDLTLENGVSTITGHVGRSLSFDASEAQRAIVVDEDFELTAPVSVSFWMNINTYNAKGAAFSCLHYVDTPVSYGFNVIPTAAGSLKIECGNGGALANNTWTSMSEIALDTWIHVVIVYDSGSFTLYLNNDDKTPWSQSCSFTGIEGLVLARWATNYHSMSDNSYFDGAVDDVRVFSNHALTASEVDNLYNDNTISTGLIAYYPMAKWQFVTKSERDYVFDPVEEGATYYCKIRSVSIYGRKENFDNAPVNSKLIVGKTSTPSNITNLTAVASNDVVNIQAEAVSDSDIIGYEVRLGDAWNGGLFIAFNETPNIRLAGVRPGTHTFWMAPRNNAGKYADAPVYATVTVFYPANYAEKNSWSWDFTTGTFDNTEHDTYETEDSLKCSHCKGDLIADDMSSWITDWTEANNVNGDVTQETGYALLDSNTAASNNYASLYQNVAIPSDFTIEVEIQHDALGTLANYDHALLAFWDGTYRVLIAFASDGLYVFDGASWNEVDTDLVQTGEVQTWRFVGTMGTTMDVYLTDSTHAAELVGTDVDISDTYADTARLRFYQYGYTTNDRLSRLDNVIVQSGNIVPGTELVGTWLSPEYNLGSKKKVRVWGDFRTAFESGSLTWDNLIPPPTTWNTALPPTMTWFEFFNISMAGNIRARLLWGDSPGSLIYDADYFHILAPEIDAQYVQVEVIITDPNDGSNLYLKELSMKGYYWQ